VRTARNANNYEEREPMANPKALIVNPDGFIKKPSDDDSLRIAIEPGLKKIRIYNTF